MPLPHAVARFNRRFTNRFLEPVARRGSGFCLVTHTGRRSGRSYRTPVNLFTYRPPRASSARPGGPRRFVVALTYGPGADWVKNVLAGQASITTRGVTAPIAAATVIDRPTAWPSLPRAVRVALRLLTVRHFLLLEPATSSGAAP